MKIAATAFHGLTSILILSILIDLNAYNSDYLNGFELILYFEH